MFVMPDDTSAVWAVAHYRVLTREQLGRIAYRNRNPRVVRARLQFLLGADLVNRTRMEAANPTVLGSYAPVYYSSRRGLAYLVQEGRLPEESLTRINCDPPHWMYLVHHTTLAEFHWRLDQSVALQPGLAIDEWISEQDLNDPVAREPHHKYRLYGLLREQPRRLVVNVDAAFLLSKDGYRKVMVVEADRDTTQDAKRVAAQKAPGVWELAQRRGHLRWFPTATADKFLVLMIAPTEKRREALRKAFAAHPGSDLWRFAAWPDLEPERLLTQPIFWTCAGEARSLTVASEPAVLQAQAPCSIEMTGSNP